MQARCKVSEKQSAVKASVIMFDIVKYQRGTFYSLLTQ